DPDALSVILSASSFSDLIDQLDYARQVAGQDKEIAAEVSAAKSDVAAARERTRQTRHGVAVETNAIASRTNEARRVRDRLVVSHHGNGLATAYAHQSAIAVSNGASVEQAETIGYVGCTGHCFGPHLHFEVRVNGTPVDPLGYL